MDSQTLQKRMAERLMMRLPSGSTEYSMIWKPQVTPAQRLIYRLAASARRISGQGFGGWPTPMHMDHWMTNNPRKDGRQNQLPNIAAMAGWPTPTIDAKDYTPEAAAQFAAGRRTKHGLDLGGAAQMAGWPTPMAGTPKQKGYNEAGNTDSSRKTVALAGWATPTAEPANGEPEAFLERKRRAVEKGSQMGISLTDLQMQAKAYLSGQPPNGSSAATERRGALNPAMSRWLQGYPWMWDNAAVRIKKRKK